MLKTLHSNIKLEKFIDRGDLRTYEEIGKDNVAKFSVTSDSWYNNSQVRFSVGKITNPFLLKMYPKILDKKRRNSVNFGGSNIGNFIQNLRKNTLAENQT